MNTSVSIVKLVPALLAAKKQFKPALKTATNPHFKSKYVDLQTVVDATEEALTANDLVLIQTPGTYIGSEAYAVITTRLIHASGEWIEDTLTLPAGSPQRFDAQTVGSAITYARRYSYMGILGIAPEDDDGSTASGTHAVKPMQQVPKPAPKPPVNEDADDEPMWDEDGNLVETKASIANRNRPPAEVPSVKPASGRRVTVPMAKRFVALALSSGKKWPEINAALKAIGIEKPEELPSDQYDVFCAWAQEKVLA